MSLESVTLAGRRAAERLMLDQGKAMRPTGGTAYDPSADNGKGADVDQYAPLFESHCKIQTENVEARTSEVGARTAVEVRTELHLPADTAPLMVGDIWEMTAPHALSFAAAGQRLRVTAPVAGSFKTARRYVVEEVVA